MANKLHGRATTTPAIRKRIQESKDTIAVLAERYHINPKTVIKWKHRKSVQDKKCGPPSESKSLTKEQEAVAVAFRKHTKLSLEDCLYSLKKTIPHLSRSSLYRCYKRHGINRIKEPKKAREKKNFKVYPPGYVHVDITEMRTEEGKLYLFVGIDRTTKFCFTRLYKNQTADTAVKFLRAMHASFPNLINKILTDNGAQFTRHKGDKEGHIFTKTCKELAIEHRRTKPYHPWTNGQVERMNRTIKQATVKKFYYKNHNLLERHLQAFINAYNYTQSLKALKGLCPYEKVCLYLRSEQGKSYLNPNHKITGPYN